MKKNETERLLHTLKEVIATIPHGSVATIEELATFIDASENDVIAWASKEIDDPTIPIHRVVRDNGELPFTTSLGSWENQKQLLQNEGVTFLTDTIVDAHRHLWRACDYYHEDS